MKKVIALCKSVDAGVFERLKQLHVDNAHAEKYDPFQSFLISQVPQAPYDSRIPNIAGEKSNISMFQTKDLGLAKISKSTDEKKEEQPKYSVFVVPPEGQSPTNDTGKQKIAGEIDGWGLLLDPQPSEWICEYEEVDGDNEGGGGANTPGFTSQHLSPCSRRRDSATAEISLPMSAKSAISIAPDFFTRSQMLFQGSPVFNGQQNNGISQPFCRKKFRLEDDPDDEESNINKNKSNNNSAAEFQIHQSLDLESKQQQQHPYQQFEINFQTDKLPEFGAKISETRATEGLATACSSERSPYQPCQNYQKQYQQPQYQCLTNTNQQSLQPPPTGNKLRKGSFCPVLQQVQEVPEHSQDMDEEDEELTPPPQNSGAMLTDSPFFSSQPELVKATSSSMIGYCPSVSVNPHEASLKAISKRLEKLLKILEKISSTSEPRKYILNSQLSVIFLRAILVLFQMILGEKEMSRDCQKCVSQCLAKIKLIPLSSFLRMCLHIIKFQIYSNKFKITSGEKQKDIAWECQKSYSKGFSHLEGEFQSALSQLSENNDENTKEILSELQLLSREMALPSSYPQLITFVKQLKLLSTKTFTARSNTSINISQSHRPEPPKIFKQPYESHKQITSSNLLSSHRQSSSSDAISLHKQQTHQPFSQPNLQIHGENNNNHHL